MRPGDLKIHELIEDLRRFPQDAEVRLGKPLLVNIIGGEVYDANCGDDELPEKWE